MTDRALHGICDTGDISAKGNEINKQDDNYIPALRFGWLTSFYDPVVRLSTRESVFKRALLAQACIGPDDKVLDMGCGTATLAIAIKATVPQAVITGMDGDSSILEIAENKAAQADVSISFDHGFSYATPYDGQSFDRVLNSLFFHHLTTENKCRTLKEIERILKPGGELHIADWGKPQNVVMRGLFFLVQLLDGFETTHDNVKGRLPALIRDAGFEEVQQTAEFATPLGTISLLSAKKPMRRV